MNRLTAPWDPAVVQALNEYQKAGKMHPYTCPNHDEGEHVLVATGQGWTCPDCDYTQDWAHDWSTHPDFRSFQKPDITALLQASKPDDLSQEVWNEMLAWSADMGIRINKSERILSFDEWKGEPDV